MITLSVELVGVYLVFSTLILPVLAVSRYQGRHGYTWAYLVGIIGYMTGLWLSATIDLPAGASIVLTLALATIAFRLLYSRLVLNKSIT